MGGEALTLDEGGGPLDLGDVERALVGEEGHELSVGGRGRLRGGDVELGAVARGEQGRLRARVGRAERRQRLARLSVGEGQPLAHLDAAGAVVGAEHDQAHASGSGDGRDVAGARGAWVVVWRAS